MIINTLKTLTAAAAFATFGIAAQAATVAEITVDGEFGILDYDGGVEALVVGGGFTGFVDPAFDTTEVNDFLFELDLSVSTPPATDPVFEIDEELFVEDITGDDIIGFALFLLSELDATFPGLIDGVVGEVLDGDLAQTEILPGIFFGFDFTVSPTGPGAGEGTFEIVLSETSVDGLSIVGATAGGFFSGAATISTVPAVPLPASLPLLALGGAGLMALGRRRKA